jgi:hypothetical protein
MYCGGGVCVELCRISSRKARKQTVTRWTSGLVALAGWITSRRWRFGRCLPRCTRVSRLQLQRDHVLVVCVVLQLRQDPASSTYIDYVVVSQN